jgi:hypothetical protein
VALGADDVEPARLHHGLGRLGALGGLDLDRLFGLEHDIAKTLDLGADLRDLGFLLGRISDVGGFLRHPHVDIAAELDVGTAARHVGGDRDRAGHAGFRDDIGLLLVEARIEHGELLARLA